MKYVKQLDAIRAIAVIFVIMSHWLPVGPIQEIPWGSIGVDIFFVLSGYLITRILLENRNQSIQDGKMSVIKTFIVRRTLRIFPVYYITIFLLASHFPFLRSHFVYFLTYTSNFVMYNRPEWVGNVSHLWSLAVEEQFYLFWPWIMIFASQKWLLRIILGFISFGILSKVFFYFYYPSNYHVHIITVTCFDAFGIGALLSYFSVYRKEELPKLFSLAGKASIVSLLFLAVIIWFDEYEPIGRTFAAICALTFIMYALAQKKDQFSKHVLENRALIFIGKLSYGIYIFHFFVPGAMRLIIKFFEKNSIHLSLIDDRIKGPLHFTAFFIVCFIALLVLAWLSWTLIEKPFLKLKGYFEYKKPKHKMPITEKAVHSSENGVTLHTKTNPGKLL